MPQTGLLASKEETRAPIKIAGKLICAISRSLVDTGHQRRSLCKVMASVFTLSHTRSRQEPGEQSGEESSFTGMKNRREHWGASLWIRAFVKSHIRKCKRGRTSATVARATVPPVWGHCRGHHKINQGGHGQARAGEIEAGQSGEIKCINFFSVTWVWHTAGVIQSLCNKISSKNSTFSLHN